MDDQWLGKPRTSFRYFFESSTVGTADNFSKLSAMDRRRYWLLSRTSSGHIYCWKQNVGDVSDFRGKTYLQFKFRHCLGLCGIFCTFRDGS